jgi:hypothetical protein
MFLLVRQLADAQFRRADRSLSERLWQEAAALELDPDRLTHLLYGVADPADLHEMEAVDRSYDQTITSEGGQGWAPRWSRLMGLGRRVGAWHQSAPPTASPAHP